MVVYHSSMTFIQIYDVLCPARKDVFGQRLLPWAQMDWAGMYEPVGDAACRHVLSLIGDDPFLEEDEKSFCECLEEAGEFTPREREIIILLANKYDVILSAAR